MSVAEEDRVIEKLIHMGVVDPDYRLFFVKKLRALGASKLMQAADKAMKFGKDPQRYFASLTR